MGGDNESHPKALIQIEHQGNNTLGCSAVQVTGRFVSQDHARLVHHGPCNGDTLLFPPGELGGGMLLAMSQANLLKHGCPKLPGSLPVLPSGQQGQDDIIQGIQGRKEVIELEDKPDVVPPETGQRRIACCDQVNAVDVQLAMGGSVYPTQQVQQGGLAATTRADNDDELSLAYR